MTSAGFIPGLTVTFSKDFKLGVKKIILSPLVNVIVVSIYEVALTLKF